MARPAAKPVTQFNAKVLAKDAVILAFRSGDEEAFYVVHPTDLNNLIERVLVASIDEKIVEARIPPSASQGGFQKVLTLPLERVSASHSPEEGTVGILLTLPSGLRLTFELEPETALALSKQLQVATGKSRLPKSQAKH
jgi:hypothetical protein